MITMPRDTTADHASRAVAPGHEVRSCSECGDDFTTSKYKDARTCSPKCRALKRWSDQTQYPRLTPGVHCVDGVWWRYFPSGSRHLLGDEKVCVECGETFRPLISQGDAEACSRACSNRIKGRKAVGVRRPGFSPPGATKKRGRGYVIERVSENDPFLSMQIRQGWVLQHRLVMARALGRTLRPSETVHHINGDKSDNRLVNLELRQGNHGKGIALECACCGSRDLREVPLAALPSP